MSEPRPKGKSFAISKWVVWEAYQRVKANDGAPGVDGTSIEEFERDLKGNLYKLWNRLSSGSYFPAPVRAVEIPKKHGHDGVRVPRRAHGGRPYRSDGRTPVSRAEGGASVPSRLVRLPARALGAASGGSLPRTMLESKLGDRSRHQSVLSTL